MNFIELVKKRYSVRKYQDKRVEEEIILKILEAGRVAPTAHNGQPQRMIVVQQKEGLEKLKKAGNIYDAPLAIIVCGNHNAAWKRPADGKKSVDIDTSIITDHMMLQATELGLGTVWICHFDPKIVITEFNLPDHIEPINILAIGYGIGESASPERHAEKRKPLKDTVSFESYNLD